MSRTVKFSDKRYAAAQQQRYAQLKEDRKLILSSESSFYMREAFKTLRTNVNFSLAGVEGCKIILVTSSLQSEGKSITALNLAISLAQTDKRVLIIDCDLRQPRLHRLLNVHAASGLSNLLMDTNRMDVTLFHHEEYNLDLILSGDIPPNPAELLTTVRMQNLLSTLRQRYDYIILDTPPVDLVADAMVLANNSDGVLFVVKAEHTERGALINAMRQLEYANAKVLGFVLNGVKPTASYGYGKYKYGKYGKYGYGEYGSSYGSKNDEEY